MTSAASLQLLVLGGTSWIGGAAARRALDRGHRVTCLARGESGQPPAGVRWVRADRAEPTAYDDVAGERWDAVVDVSWQPALVRSALSRLAGRTTHWLYVSSASVYPDDRTVGAREDAALHEPYTGEGPADVEVYGPAKVACERACLEALGGEHVLLARAGLIGGYGDRSDRLGYWPARVRRARDGEPVLVPPRGQSTQVIDAEDLTAWLVLAAEERVAGAYNAVGDVSTVGAVLDASTAAAGRSPELEEASDDWLVAQGVQPWTGPESLPLWLPSDEYAGFSTRRNDAARAAGLELRPLQQTVSAALEWEERMGLGRDRRAGLTPSRETDLLARLHVDM